MPVFVFEWPWESMARGHLEKRAGKEGMVHLVSTFASTRYSTPSFSSQHCSPLCVFRFSFSATQDTLFQDIKRLLYNSSYPDMKEIWPDGKQDKGAVTKRPPTAGKIFKQSMLELVTQLEAKEPFYVRCVKPNGTKSSSQFDEEMVLNQVRYLGLVENARVRGAGYAHRQPYEHFVERYKLCCDETWPFYRGSAKDGTAIITQSMGLTTARSNPEKHDVAMGKTKIFIAGVRTLAMLEERRTKKIPEIVIKIQTAWRGYMCRQNWKRIVAAFRIIKRFKKYKQIG